MPHTKDETVSVIRETYGWDTQIKHIADLIWSFLQNNINLSEQNYKGETLLNYAIGRADDNEIIEFLLSIPTIDVNQNDSDRDKCNIYFHDLIFVLRYYLLLV
jgi:hypothetical protein